MEDSSRLSHPSTPLPGLVFPAALDGELEGHDAVIAAKERALQAVFDAQSDALKNVLRSYVMKSGLARGHEAREITLDLYSELYLAAMKTAEKFDLSRSGLPWLLRIGYHLVLRKRDEQMRLRQHEAPLADLASPAPDEARADADVFDRLAALCPLEGAVTPLEARHAASELLALVSSEDRALLQLAVVRGLSGEALAEQLGINPPAARQRLHRAIGRLRIAYDHHFKASEVRRG